MRIRIALAAAVAALGVAAAPAAAHPLGNFSVNHVTQVRISADRVDVRYLLDQAEIPTFRERGLSDAAVLRRKRDEVARRLVLTVDGRTVALRPGGAPRLTHPAGQGGLRTTRLELPLTAAVRGARTVAVRDGTFPGRVGWKAVQALPGRGTAVRTGAPATDPTGGLRRYPADLLESPSDVRDATFAVAPGDGTLDAAAGRVSTGGATARRRLRRPARRRRRARPPAARRVRLGRGARALAGARQGDGGGLPRRHARQLARRRPARRHRDGHAHGRRGRARRRRARPLGLDPARAALPVAQPRVRACSWSASASPCSAAACASAGTTTTTTTITTTDTTTGTTTTRTTAAACSRSAPRPA